MMLRGIPTPMPMFAHEVKLDEDRVIEDDAEGGV